MWIISAFSLINLFLISTYSLISYLSENCIDITNSEIANNLLYLVWLILTLIVWQYPIIYIFWPSSEKEEKYVDARKSFDLSSERFTSNSLASSRTSLNCENEYAMR